MPDDGERVPTDAELAAAILAGDPAAESALVERLTRPLRLIFRVQRVPAAEIDDLVQETLLILLRRLRVEPIREVEGVRGFAQVTARQLAETVWRKRARRQHLLDQHGELLQPVPELVPEHALSDAQIVECIQICLKELSQPRDRLLVREHYLNGVDKPVLCERLGLTAAQFDRTIFNARTRLKSVLLRYGIGALR